VKFNSSLLHINIYCSEHFITKIALNATKLSQYDQFLTTVTLNVANYRTDAGMKVLNRSETV